jgi:hypothetical protein
MERDGVLAGFVEDTKGRYNYSRCSTGTCSRVSGSEGWCGGEGLCNVRKSSVGQQINELRSMNKL